MANADARANIARQPAPSSSSSLPDPDDPADVKAMLCSWPEWDEDRIRGALRGTMYRLFEVVRQIAKGQTIWAIHGNRANPGSPAKEFLELLKAVERARESLRRRIAA